MKINELQKDLQEKGFLVEIVEGENKLRIHRDSTDIFKHSIYYNMDTRDISLSMLHQNISMDEAEDVFNYYTRAAKEINKSLSKRKPYIAKLDLSIASEEEINNIIGCILNEDVSECDFCGTRITFINLKDNKTLFYDASERSFKAVNIEDNSLIIDVIMSSEQTREFKDNIKKQIKEIRG